MADKPCVLLKRAIAHHQKESSMKAGTVIQIHGTTGIVLALDGACALCKFSDGRTEWVFIPNHINSTLKIITDKKCP